MMRAFAAVAAVFALAFSARAQTFTINVASGSLSSPSDLQTVKLTGPGAPVVLYQGGNAVLSPGSYSVDTYGGEGHYGSFDLDSLGNITASGAATSPAPGTVGFDLSRLASVSIPASALSTPTGYEVISIFQVTGGIYGADATLHLPDGAFTMQSYGGQGAIGTFQVSGGSAVSPTGALVLAAGGLGFDLTKLAPALIAVSTLSSPRGLSIASLADASTNIFGIDVTLSLPPTAPSAPSYRVQTADGKVFGSFTVSPALALTAPTGGTLVSPGAVSFSSCALHNLQISFAPGVGGFVESASSSFSGTAVLLLPDGNYALDLSTAERVTFTLGTGISITAGSGNVALSLLNCSSRGTTNLISTINAAALPKGISSQLTAKLDAALSALARGNGTAAVGQLQAFINATQAQSGKAIAPDVAAQLVAEATALIAAIQSGF